MLNISRQLAVLDQLYKIYDQFSDSLDIACKKFCADCCTCNVTLTTLEAHKIMSSLSIEGRHAMNTLLKQNIKKKRFLPKITINQLADICLAGGDPPEEDIDPEWGPCLLLKNDECPAYSHRPFGCRCMVSKQRCKDIGMAEIDEFTLTVNNVFLQYIEHIDQNGRSGNFLDVMIHVLSNDLYGQDAGSEIRQSVLIKNSPLRALLIPPEHQKKIEPILAALHSIT